VIVNHFKSKSCSGASGDNADARDGQSCYNGDRVRQAQALAIFAD
jgi:predicted extracellular nuclease